MATASNCSSNTWDAENRLVRSEPAGRPPTGLSGLSTATITGTAGSKSVWRSWAEEQKRCRGRIATNGQSTFENAVINQTAYDELTAVSVTGYTVTATDAFGNRIVNYTGGDGVVYPYGTDGYRVTTDPLGVQTVTRTYYEGNAEISETASAGVTNRTTRYWGGATVTEMFWDGKWTRETLSTAYDESGCRVETVTRKSSDYPVYVATVTAYDFLGREVSVAVPLNVTSNFYDGASDRVIRMSRTGSPDTLYVYDELGNVSVTATDVDGDGQAGSATDLSVNS